MPIDPSVAIGADLGARTFSWTESDVLLYHLGIGAGSRAGGNLSPAALAYTLRPWAGPDGWAGLLAWPDYLVLVPCVALLLPASTQQVGATLVFGETAAIVVSAPLFEEAAKGMGVYWAVRRREVDGVSDGIVYAGWVALGFAVVEDATYFALADVEGDLLQDLMALYLYIYKIDFDQLQIMSKIKIAIKMKPPPTQTSCTINGETLTCHVDGRIFHESGKQVKAKPNAQGYRHIEINQKRVPKLGTLFFLFNNLHQYHKSLRQYQRKVYRHQCVL